MEDVLVLDWKSIGHLILNDESNEGRICDWFFPSRGCFALVACLYLVFFYLLLGINLDDKKR